MMSRSVKKRWTLVGVVIGMGTTLAMALGLGVFAGAGTAASSAAPKNTSPPTLTGTPREGQVLTGDKGTWSNSPTDYNYFWTRCDKTGGSCANISGAHGATYTLTSADVGNTLRFKVQANNADGSTSASSVPTAVIVAATKTPPHNTSVPTITGTPQKGQMLTGDRGTWSNSPTDYNYFWMRCGKNGGSCANISGANGTTYTLTSADVGNTLRFKVQATNADGSTFASSVPTAVIAAASAPPPPAPATGCPSGTGPVQVSAVSPPARLLIDQQQSSPSVVSRGASQLIARYHVSACGGRSVQGALVYATATPFNQLSIPPEQTTDSSGWTELDFRMLAGFPVSSKQQLIAIFARARKSGEDLLGGISTRRLFSVQVNLNG
jgi:hypothetical protein